MKIIFFATALWIACVSTPGFARDPIIINKAVRVWCGKDAIITEEPAGLYWEHLISGKKITVEERALEPQPESLTHIYPLDCSPDGAWIAYQAFSLKQRAHVLLYNITTGKKYKIASGLYTLKWAPDGKKLYYIHGHMVEGDEERDDSEPYFKIPEDLAWQALRIDDSVYDVVTPIWLPDSSGVVYAENKTPARITQLKVAENGFAPGKTIWDGKKGQVHVIRTAGSNTIFAVRFLDAPNHLEYLKCSYSTSWECRSYWEVAEKTFYYNEVMSDSSVIYVPDDASRTRNEIWIMQKNGKKRKLKTLPPNRIGIIGIHLSPDDRYLSYL